MALIWTLAVIGFGIAEALTVQLVSIWLAGGAFAALIAALAGVPQRWQLWIFLLVSAVLLVCTYPVVKRFRRRKSVPTNKDALIGEKAIITEDIDNIAEKGALKLHGIEWSARSENGSAIKKGAVVRICSVSGVKLFVEEIKED